jgi:hypothetical protein
MSTMRVSQLRFVAVSQDDPLAAPLLAELAVEYAERYDGNEERILAWLRGYPAVEFAPPTGGLLIGLLSGEPVTGGWVPPVRLRYRRAQARLDRQPVPAPRPREGAAGSTGVRDHRVRLPPRVLDDG